MIELINSLSGIASILMLGYLILDRYIRERKRAKEEARREGAQKRDMKEKFDNIQKRIYKLEVSSILILECLLGNKTPEDIKSEILELLYKNPGYKKEILHAYLESYSTGDWSLWESKLNSTAY